MFTRKFRKKYIIRITFGLIMVAIIVLYASGWYLYADNMNQIQDEKQARILNKIADLSRASAIIAKKHAAVDISLPGAIPIKAIIDNYSLPNSIWAIVSKSHPISVDYVPPALKIPNVATRTDKSDAERSIRSDIEVPLINMFAAASAAGYQLMVSTGYRSAALQKVDFDNMANTVDDTVANQSIDRPGQNEHQTGLAIDISTTSGNCYLDACFANTGEGSWLTSNVYKFGFILRYPKDKETVTGYRYEPWHFRYVGIDLATAIHESNLTFDEVWHYLEKADATLRQNGSIQ